MALKKQPARRRPAKAEAAAPAAQSATERRSAEAQLSTLVTKYAAERARAIAAMRRALQKRLPTAHEIVYEYNGFFVISYSPSAHGYEGVLALRGDAEGIKLYFTRGKELQDPAKLLRGTSQTRWVNLESAATLARPDIATLIDAAIKLNSVPFARTGRGSILISPSTRKRVKAR